MKYIAYLLGGWLVLFFLDIPNRVDFIWKAKRLEAVYVKSEQAMDSIRGKLCTDAYYARVNNTWIVKENGIVVLAIKYNMFASDPPFLWSRIYYKIRKRDLKKFKAQFQHNLLSVGSDWYIYTP